MATSLPNFQPRRFPLFPVAKSIRVSLLRWLVGISFLIPAAALAQNDSAAAEASRAVAHAGAFEPILKSISIYLASGVEGFAAIIIGAAAIEATVRALLLFFQPKKPPEAKEAVRLRLGRWLALALEFELAADILRTAIAPTWNEIGQLAAIVVLRTALNYFLQQEIDKAEAKNAHAMG